VADLLESLTVVAGTSRAQFVSSSPPDLRAARTCYDHVAGTLGVALHDTLITLEWLAADAAGPDGAYAVTEIGAGALSSLGIDVDALHKLRRRFAFACLDWSERRPHIGGALGAALRGVLLKNGWVRQEPRSRVVHTTALGRRELSRRFGIRVA
jgi:hypothetical protein